MNYNEKIVREMDPCPRRQIIGQRIIMKIIVCHVFIYFWTEWENILKVIDNLCKKVALDTMIFQQVCLFEHIYLVISDHETIG